MNEWKVKRWSAANLAIRVLEGRPFALDAASLLVSLAFV
jgi:hypothetical protein